MPREPLRQFLQHLRQVIGVNNARALDDAELLERFVSRRDGAAFEVLVWRHGGLVLDVCGRLLQHPQDIEDAFQATFLVLVRQAKGIRKRAALASWLYKVAYNVALRARRGMTGPNAPPTVTAALPAPDAHDAEQWRDLKPVLDDEISQLPEKYRAAVVLCYLQGLTTADAARQLGCARGTIHSRLAWARARLRSRLVRRGVAISLPGLAAALSSQAAAAVPVSLVGATIRLALLATTSKAATRAGVLAVATLVEGVMRTMFLAKLRVLAAALLLVCALGLGVGVVGPRVLADKSPAPAPARVPGKPDTIQLPAELLARLGIQTADVKARGDLGGPVLRLRGVLTYDPGRVVSVRSRFAGEAVEIGQASSTQFFPPSLALIQTQGASGTSSGKIAWSPLPLTPAQRKMFGSSSTTSGTSSSSSGSSTAQGTRAPHANIGLGTATLSSYRLRVGDKVSKGQLLAVVYSKELGMKQLEFVDAVARAELDRKQLEATQELFNERLIKQSVLHSAEREAHLSARKALNARRTLLLWKLSPEEIDALARDSRKKGGAEIEKRLGKIVIRAPIDGVIVESNVGMGDITTPESIVFRIVDLSRLQVVANASERDLTALRALPAAQRRWTIRADGAPAVQGRITSIPGPGRPQQQGALDAAASKLFIDRTQEAGIDFLHRAGDLDQGKGTQFSDLDSDGWIDLFGHIGKGTGARFLDFDNDGLADLYVAESQGGRSYRNRGDGLFEDVTPNTHSPVIGWADNSAGRLHAGQFISATVQLPATRQEAAIPTSALVLEAGKEYVIVQPDSNKLQYTPRRVLVIRRDRHVAHIRTQPSAAEIRQGFQSVRPGERIITRGAVEVKGMVAELRD
jgi:RNA polymerase sigma factor (sigma-70 family)